MTRFVAELVPVSHGGHCVHVPAAAAEEAGLAHGARVRGTVNRVPYRSSLMKYSGVFHLGVHKAVLQQAGAAVGDRVMVTLERDPEPLPGDEPPEDLLRAMRKNRLAREGYAALSPAHRREHVKHVLEAKKPETRARRIAQAIAAFEEQAGVVAARKR